MTDETGTSTVDPFEGIGESDSTAEETAGTEQAPQQQPQQQTTRQPAPQRPTAPTQPQEKMLPQSEVNRIIEERLQRQASQATARERALAAQYEQQMEQLRQARQGGATEEQQDVYAERIAAIEQQFEDISLERELDRLASRYPDFRDNEVEIMQIALTERVRNLEAAYRIWKYDKLSSVDLAEIERRAVQNYVSGKQDQAATTPTPEGAGGGTPGPAAPKKIKSFDDAERASEDRIERAKRNGG